MKHGQSVCQGRGVSLALAGCLFTAAPAAVKAQITGQQPTSYQPAATANTGGHSHDSSSGYVDPYDTSRGGGSGVARIRRGELQRAAIIDTGYIKGTGLVSTDMRDADLWARAIIHADGSYTETEKKGNDQMITQKTLSAGGVLLQERIITANGQGFPSEVLIRDAHGNFKYRGVLLYDRFGRFVEEQLFDMNNQLLRRRVQDYEPGGEPKLRVLDYAENLPTDIQLVITEKSAAGNNAEGARRNYNFFRRNAREVPANAAASQDTAASGGERRRPGLLGRIFGRKKRS